MGSHWTVTDDEPLLVTKHFGGGGRIWARRKSMDETFQPFVMKQASLTGRKLLLDLTLIPHGYLKLRHCLPLYN